MFPSRISLLSGDSIRDAYSLEFDGSNDYVNIGDISAFDFGTGSFTVGCWAKMTSYNTSYMVSKTNNAANETLGWGLKTSSARWTFHVGDGTDSGSVVSGVSSSLINRWYHVVGTFNGSTQTSIIYVNGIQDNTTTNTDVGSTSNAISVSIGRLVDSNYFTGFISDVFIYNSELSKSQVSTLYNNRKPYNHKDGVASGNLAGWWRMGDGKEIAALGTKVYDMSANSNVGTLTNMDAGNYTGDTP